MNEKEIMQAEQAALDALVAHVMDAPDRGVALQAAYVVVRAQLTVNDVPLEGLDRRTEKLVSHWRANPDGAVLTPMSPEPKN